MYLRKAKDLQSEPVRNYKGWLDVNPKRFDNVIV